MAYVSKEMKAKAAPIIKAICKKYGVKASLAVRHHSTLVLNIKSAKIDFIASANRMRAEEAARGRPVYGEIVDHIQVNEYYTDTSYDGKAREFFAEVIPALYGPDYFNDDDSQTDYFHRSHYIDINVGQWNKPFVFEG